MAHREKIEIQMDFGMHLDPTPCFFPFVGWSTIFPRLKEGSSSLK
jgi:hypothetical protein